LIKVLYMAENRKRACHSRGNISQKGCSLL
jgi:hypothetical protein